jgi:arylsulfatase A-like enzyme
MKNFIPLLLTSLLVFSCSTREELTPPNIIFIMSDDHAYQAISAYQDHLIQTPNIDRLAKEGMLFNNACVTNSLCAPSRATILTGKHCHVHGKIDNRLLFDTAQVTFPQLFQEAGYQTAMFGKLHFGNNPKGIDEFKILPGQGNYYNPDFITNEGKIQIEGYTTDIITDLTMDWLQHRRDPDKPFLLFFLHKAPHREWLPAERHYVEYTNKIFPEPATLFDDYEGRGTAAREAEMNILLHQNWSGDSKLRPEALDELGITPASDWDKRALESKYERFTEEQLAAWNRVYDPITEDFKQRYPSMTEEDKMRWKYQRYMQDYLACIAAVDEGVGTLLDYLDQEGLTESTIVVYTSDQGFYLGEHGWFDKRFIYNESFKTPLLIRWPGVVAPGSTNEEMVQNLDFAQTFLEAAGIEAPADMQGKSFIPLLKGEDESWDRDAVYYHYYEYPAVHMVKRHYGIVTKEYKLAHFYYDIDEWELYDRMKDPMEMKNEYDNPEYAEVLEMMKAKLAETRLKYKDSEELDRKYIELYENR